MQLYGSSLLQWVKSHYFRNTGILELHIYDRDADSKYQEACLQVNRRDDGSVAFLTKKPSIENYFHIDLVNMAFGIDLCESKLEPELFDVIEAAVKAVKQKPKSDPIRQKIRAGSALKDWKNKAKYHLHEAALPRITMDHLRST